jgi:arabinose-5-phosphate isomerase
MFTEDNMPLVIKGSGVGQALVEMDAKGIGATIVIDNDQRLVGILTDGDLRRALLKNRDIYSMKVEDIMTTSPKTVDEDMTAAEALGLMELYGITHLIILDEDKRVKGVIHLHDLLGREEFRINGGHAPAKRVDC